MATTFRIGVRIRAKMHGLIEPNDGVNFKSRIAHAMAGTFALNIAFAGLSFVVGLLTARWLGVTEYGTYVYIISWCNALVVPAMMGLDGLAVREVAVYEAQAKWSLLRGLLRRTSQLVLLYSFGLVLVASAVIWSIGLPFRLTFVIGLLLLPILATNRVRQAALQGLQRVALGQLPETVIRPSVFILLFMGGHLLLGTQLTAMSALSLDIAAAGIALLVGMVLLKKHLPQEVRNETAQFRTKRWLADASALSGVSLLAVANLYSSTLILGAIRGTEEVAIYNVAARGAWLVSFAQVAVNTALAPTVAALFAKSEMGQLQRVVTQSVRGGFLIALPIGLGMFIFGDWFLGLFGASFTAGYMTLMILTLGQMVSAGSGSVGALLNMTGHQRDAARGAGLGVLFNIILNLLLIPAWGVEGAAVATTCSIGVWYLALTYWVYRRVGIHTTVFGDIRRWNAS